LTSITEISLQGGQLIRVRDDAKQVEAKILSAARGSIMEFAWMTEAESGDPVGINPEHVMALRAVAD
jgi:hypothetical protein